MVIFNDDIHSLLAVIQKPVYNSNVESENKNWKTI